MNEIAEYYKLARIFGEEACSYCCEQENRNALLNGIFNQMFQDERVSEKLYAEGKACIKALVADRNEYPCQYWG